MLCITNMRTGVFGIWFMCMYMSVCTYICYFIYKHTYITHSICATVELRGGGWLSVLFGRQSSTLERGVNSHALEFSENLSRMSYPRHSRYKSQYFGRFQQAARNIDTTFTRGLQTSLLLRIKLEFRILFVFWEKAGSRKGSKHVFSHEHTFRSVSMTWKSRTLSKLNSNKKW